MTFETSENERKSTDPIPIAARAIRLLAPAATPISGGTLLHGRLSLRLPNPRKLPPNRAFPSPFSRRPAGTSAGSLRRTQTFLLPGASARPAGSPSSAPDHRRSEERR